MTNEFFQKIPTYPTPKINQRYLQRKSAADRDELLKAMDVCDEKWVGRR